MSIISEIRSTFPTLSRVVYGHKLVYLDNAATMQKPLCVLEMQEKLYRDSYANVHRAVHRLSSEATDFYEAGRQAVIDFIGAGSREEVVLTNGATASLNLLATCFTQQFVKRGDRILITESEHHANIVPWQLACQRCGAVLEVIPIDDSGCLNPAIIEAHLDGTVKLLSIPHVSNVLGVVNPIKQITVIAHQHNIPVAIDGAQGIVHQRIDIKDIDCDFYVFSGHKIYSPTGIGVLYGKKQYLEAMPPYMGGGEMIETVSFDRTTYAPLPLKYEAGTPNFVAAACLKPALETAAMLMDNPELQLLDRQKQNYLMEELPRIEGLRLYGTPCDHNQKAPVFSFTVEGVHPSDLAQILDKMGIAVRSGFMCAEPLIRKYSDSGMLRVSLASYNTLEECICFVDSLKKAISMLR